MDAYPVLVNYSSDVVFFLPCYEGRFDTLDGDEVIPITPIRPAGLEKRFSLFCQVTNPASHVEKHQKLQELADIKAFNNELSIEIAAADHYDPCWPWLVAYHFSLGPWQDLIGRLQAQYAFFRGESQ